MKLADLTPDEKIRLGVAAAAGIKHNLPVDGFGQTRRLNDYADIWGAAARNAVLSELAAVIADRKAQDAEAQRMSDHRLFVTSDRDIFVRLYDDGRAEVAHRDPETRRWDLEVPMFEVLTQ